ncbi:hypothetical protein FKM82_011577 [Ascaphus truei]
MQMTVLWGEVVGCLVLGSHPEFQITIQSTVFPEVAVISPMDTYVPPRSLVILLVSCISNLLKPGFWALCLPLVVHSLHFMWCSFLFVIVSHIHVHNPTAKFYYP